MQPSEEQLALRWGKCVSRGARIREPERDNNLCLGAPRRCPCMNAIIYRLFAQSALANPPIRIVSALIASAFHLSQFN